MPNTNQLFREFYRKPRFADSLNIDENEAYKVWMSEFGEKQPYAKWLEQMNNDFKNDKADHWYSKSKLPESIKNGSINDYIAYILEEKRLKVANAGKGINKFNSILDTVLSTTEKVVGIKNAVTENGAGNGTIPVKTDIGNDINNMPPPNTNETKILGMKPLVFGIVTFAVVSIVATGLYFAFRSKKTE